MEVVFEIKLGNVLLLIFCCCWMCVVRSLLCCGVKCVISLVRNFIVLVVRICFFCLLYGFVKVSLLVVVVCLVIV